MTKERFKLGVYVSLILRKGDEILLIRRAKTGVDDGLYGCAGGKIDGDEQITYAMMREAGEEIGIKLKKEDLKVVHVLHAKRNQTLCEMLGFFIEASVWEGEPKNMEPNKHDDLAWFKLALLPDNTQPALIHVLAMLDKGVSFSEFGWE